MITFHKTLISGISQIAGFEQDFMNLIRKPLLVKNGELKKKMLVKC